ncbi:MAG: hypothetical protein AB7O45_08140 [Alphaproteobacteria bacterium]
MFDGNRMVNPRADAQHVARLARELIDLLDRTAQAFDAMAAVSPAPVAADLSGHAETVRALRVGFAGPPKGEPVQD